MTSGSGSRVLRKLGVTCIHNIILFRKAPLLSYIIGEELKQKYNKSGKGTEWIKRMKERGRRGMLFLHIPSTLVRNRKITFDIVYPVPQCRIFLIC